MAVEKGNLQNFTFYLQILYKKAFVWIVSKESKATRNTFNFLQSTSYGQIEIVLHYQ